MDYDGKVNNIVRDNLMTDKSYSPYCGNPNCRTMPRTIFNGSQFYCPSCNYVSKFPKEFIDEYKLKWGIKNDNNPSSSPS